MPRPCSRLVHVAFIFAILGVLPYAGASHAQPGTAPNGDPGGFAVDGELYSNTPAGNTSDWAEGFGGLGVGLIANNGTPFDASTIHVDDAFNNADRRFVDNSRLDGNPNTEWTWDTPGMTDPIGGRDNLNHGLAHFSHDANGHAWFTWAMDRRGGGGESFLAVSLLQGSLVRNFNGTFTSTGPHDGHTVGDLALSLELPDPNVVPILTVWRWTETSPGVYGYAQLVPAVGTAFTAANGSDPVDVPWGAFGETFYPPETFSEASIDLTALLLALQPNVTFHTLLFTSRFGPPIESVLVDFIDPQPVTLVTGVSAGLASSGTDLVRVSPNPARGPVVMDYALDRSGPVSLEVFDLAGRRVASLVQGDQTAGTHSVRWDPALGQGRPRAGVFYARLTAAGVTRMRRFVVTS